MEEGTEDCAASCVSTLEGLTKELCCTGDLASANSLPAEFGVSAGGDETEAVAGDVRCVWGSSADWECSE